MSSIKHCLSESAPRLQWILYPSFLSIVSPLDNIYLKWQQIDVFFPAQQKSSLWFGERDLISRSYFPQWVFQLGNYSHVKGDSAESPAALWEHLSPTDANYLAREPSPLCGRSEGSESAGSANTTNIYGQAVSGKQVQRHRNKWAGCFSHLLMHLYSDWKAQSHSEAWKHISLLISTLCYELLSQYLLWAKHFFWCHSLKENV